MPTIFGLLHFSKHVLCFLPLGIKSCACLRAPRLTQRTLTYPQLGTLTYPQLGRFTAHTERSSNQFSFTPTEINTHTSTHRAYEHSPPTQKKRDEYKQPTNIILGKKLLEQSFHIYLSLSAKTCLETHFLTTSLKLASLLCIFVEI